MTKDSPGVIAPPPLLVLGALALTLGLDAIWPAPLFGAAFQIIAGGALFAMGAGLAGACVARFRRAGTNVPTYRPTTALVTHGPYRYSRNPIYVGICLAYLGLAVLIDSAWVLAGIVPLFAVLNVGVIAREEVYLEAKFGDAYRTYKQTARRWL